MIIIYKAQLTLEAINNIILFSLQWYYRNNHNKSVWQTISLSNQNNISKQDMVQVLSVHWVLLLLLLLSLLFYCDYCYWNHIVTLEKTTILVPVIMLCVLIVIILDYKVSFFLPKYYTAGTGSYGVQSASISMLMDFCVYHVHLW